MTAAERAREEARALLDPTLSYQRLVERIAAALLAHEAEVIERCAQIAEGHLASHDLDSPGADCERCQIAKAIRDSGRKKGEG